MESDREIAALVAVLRQTRKPWSAVSECVDATGTAEILLEQEFGLLSESAVQEAHELIDGWQRRGIRVVGRLSGAYPPALGKIQSGPPLLFIAGDTTALEHPAVAVVGTRVPSGPCLAAARAIARSLVREGFTVVSGLAAGIDTEAHKASLVSGGRTVAVIGCGLNHCYPRQNRDLQRQITARGAVVSQFWPETQPSRRTFPMRNIVAAGLSLATVIVEASQTSGTRIQARAALAQGRSVLLLASLLEQPWAQALSRQPGVAVVRTPSDVLERVTAGPSHQLVA
jgi:DNA processing protein